MTPAHNSQPSQWRELLGVAFELIDQVSTHLGGYDIPWSFGGGTAMMLQIDHRESHDIDLFFDDAQFLGHFDPGKFDFRYSIMPADYKGDGARFQKFAFAGMGEIDFIVSPNLTDAPFICEDIAGRQVNLETVAEIITKKVYFRGREAKPRDVFDIAAGARHHRQSIIRALSGYPEQVSQTLDRLTKLNPEFVDSTIRSLMIRPDYMALAGSSREIAREVLEGALELSNDPSDRIEP